MQSEREMLAVRFSASISIGYIYFIVMVVEGSSEKRGYSFAQLLMKNHHLWSALIEARLNLRCNV